eukprot:TRINITY_DN19428_c0_g1_i1.p2 TRINITY_DN19428_c0_g1~~TRINITY_DN19428_c0_g1_i1.p2  ORF type:complete len:357 (-),score=78.87 TRINITY_DN19428_c0_g1_i1:4-1074(-)
MVGFSSSGGIVPSRPLLSLLPRIDGGGGGAARAPVTRPDRWLPTNDPAVRDRRHRARLASGTSRRARADDLASLMAAAAARPDGPRLVADAKGAAAAAATAAVAVWEASRATAEEAAGGPGGGETKAACLARLVRSVAEATRGRRGAVGGADIQRLRRHVKLLRNQRGGHYTRSYKFALTVSLEVSLYGGTARPRGPSSRTAGGGLGSGDDDVIIQQTTSVGAGGRARGYGAPVRSPDAANRAAAAATARHASFADQFFNLSPGWGGSGSSGGLLSAPVCATLDGVTSRAAPLGVLPAASRPPAEADGPVGGLDAWRAAAAARTRGRSVDAVTADIDAAPAWGGVPPSETAKAHRG